VIQRMLVSGSAARVRLIQKLAKTSRVSQGQLDSDKQATPTTPTWSRTPSSLVYSLLTTPTDTRTPKPPDMPRLAPGDGAFVVNTLVNRTLILEEARAPWVILNLGAAALSNALLLLQTIFKLLDKTMGFLVGWCWYDVLISGFGYATRAHNSQNVLLSFELAVTASFFLFALVPMLSEKDIADERQASERLFLQSALGMMLGWSWSDFVAATFGAILLEAPKDPGWQVGVALAITAALTAAIVLAPAIGYKFFLSRDYRRLV